MKLPVNQAASMYSDSGRLTSFGIVLSGVSRTAGALMSALAQYKIRKHEIGDYAVFVVDSLFDEQFVRMAHHFLSRLEFTQSDYDTEETKHARHWKHEFDLHNLPSIPIIPALRSRIVAVTTELHTGGKLQLKRIHCNLHLYGDLQYPHTDLTPGVTALYFANPR